VEFFLLIAISKTIQIDGLWFYIKQLAKLQKKIIFFCHPPNCYVKFKFVTAVVQNSRKKVKIIIPGNKKLACNFDILKLFYKW